MAFFTFCINCGKKILINEPGTKLKHFSGRMIQCSKCGSNFIISKGVIKYVLDLTLKELVKLGIYPVIKFIEKTEKG